MSSKGQDEIKSSYKAVGRGGMAESRQEELENPVSCFRNNRIRRAPLQWLRLTLNDDKCRGVNSLNVIGCKARVLATVLLHDILYVEAPRMSDADAGVIGHRCAVPFRPGNSWQRVACGTALESDTFPNQHFRVLGLDDKSWPGCGMKQILGSFLLA